MGNKNTARKEDPYPILRDTGPAPLLNRWVVREALKKVHGYRILLKKIFENGIFP